MKQRKTFSDFIKIKKELILNYLQNNKEIAVGMMSAILIIGFFINVYVVFFQEDSKPLSLPPIETNDLFSSPTKNDMDAREMLKLIDLYDQLKDSTNLTEDKIKKINRNIDEIITKNNLDEN